MSKMLTEQNVCNWIIENDIMDEATKSALPPGVIMQARGKFAHAGRITSNARLYTRSWYETQIARVSRKGGELETGAMLGEADHPSPTRGGPSVRQLCFIVRGLDMSEAGEVMGRINVVGTGAGEDYAAGIRAGAQIGFSSRARGDTTPKKMNDQHPDWDLNQDWDGQDFEEVDDDASLVTFDAVLGPAISDAHVADYHEQNNPEEEDMNIKLEDVLKNEDLMKGILESESVKALVAQAVADTKKEAEAEFDKNLPGLITKYMESDEFVTRMREKLEIANPEEGKEGEGELEEAKCPDCDGPVGKGAKYCPGCGSKMAAAAPPKAESKEEADAANAELLKRVEALEKSNKELTTSNEAHDKKDEDAVTQEAIEAQVDTLLENSCELVNTRVRERLSDKELSEDNVDETVKTLVEAETAFIKQMGGEQLLETGKKGGTNDGDDDEKNEGKKDKSVALTERLVN